MRDVRNEIVLHPESAHSQITSGTRQASEKPQETPMIDTRNANLVVTIKHGGKYAAKLGGMGMTEPTSKKLERRRAMDAKDILKDEDSDPELFGKPRLTRRRKRRLGIEEKKHKKRGGRQKNVDFYRSNTNL